MSYGTVGIYTQGREKKGTIVESIPPDTPAHTYRTLLERIPTWNATVIRARLSIESGRTSLAFHAQSWSEMV
ncbi:MAG: hypothetical protein KAY09_07835 [Nitrospira sp.]|nr:hypothetical protein [Nitrospira sp.]